MALVAPATNSRDNCAFYSTPAAIAKHRAAAPAALPDIAQVIIGTTRVWYTENFGTTWVTLPSGTDPPPAGNLDHDSFGEKVTVCRWQSPDVAWILGEGRLQRYARTAGSDAASGPGTLDAGSDPRARASKPKKDTTSADGPLRDAASGPTSR